MALRVPGADTPSQFWHNLANGVESIPFLNDQQLREAGVEERLIRDPKFIRTPGGTIKDREYFDAAFFDYTPAEAMLMDPQSRIFHEIVWQALEDGGYSPDTYRGSIGLFAGASNSFMWEALVELTGKAREMGHFAASHLSSREFMPTKISYKLNLNGPSFLVQTACSTSLTAVHLAARSLLLGECNMAIAGGVSLSPLNSYGYHHTEGMILSRDGHCNPFDHRATGTIAGSGAAAVVLKPLKKALQDGDNVYAIIKGSAINNDGNRKVGYTAPSVRGQAEAIRAALNFAKVSPESIGYVECHGTATDLGDPVEIEALKQGYGSAKTQFCAVGSVKANLGHLDAAAGVTGLIKAVLALGKKQLPPSINFEKPNPKIDFEQSPFYVNAALQEWQANGTPRRAGVSSFGIGGTNVHVILEEAPRAALAGADAQYHLLLVTGKTARSLQANASQLAAALDSWQGAVPLAQVAHTLMNGRSHFAHRRFVVAASAREAAQQLLEVAQTHLPQSPRQAPPLVLLFPGGGVQHVNMGRRLYQCNATFRAVVDQGLAYLQVLSGHDYHDLLYPPGQQTPDGPPAGWSYDSLTDPPVALPLLLIVEYALGKLVLELGLKPQALVGHSLGEYVAASLAGVFSLEEAVRIVYHRGRLMGQVKPGLMLSVAAGRGQVEPLLAEHAWLTQHVSLAAVNSPGQVVLSGRARALHQLQELLTGKGIESKVLHIAVASHSLLMEPILEEFRAVLSSVAYRPAQLPLVSNRQGGWLGDQVPGVDYWVGHLRETVQFSAGIQAVLQALPGSVFAEVGPGNSLSVLVGQHEPAAGTVSLLPHALRQTDEQAYLLEGLGQLWRYGYRPDWSAYYPAQLASRIPLPTYSFDRQKYWLDNDIERLYQNRDDETEKRNKPRDWFYAPSWQRQALPAAEPAPGTGKKWIVFCDDTSAGRELVQGLGSENVDCITVEPAPEYGRRSAGAFGINPADPGHYDRLFRELKNEPVDTVLHAWALHPAAEPVTQERLTERIERSFYSLLHIARSLSGHHYTGVRINVLTGGFHEVTGTEMADFTVSPVMGPLKVIPQEYPGLVCRNIDLAWQAGQTLPVGTLVREVRSGDLTPIAAYRNGRRWVPVVHPLALNAASGRPGFVPHGTYLITGGLGRIGFTVADHLAGKYQPLLIFVGRTALPARDAWEAGLASGTLAGPVADKIRKIRHLEDKGARVVYACLDVARQDELKEFVASIRKTYGKIHGIIHSTASIDSTTFQPIADIDRDTCEKHLGAKAYGLLALAGALEGADYDFCLLMSSISSVLGGLGFVAYTAANAFMDHFTQHMNRQGDPRWISVCWDGWTYLEDELAGKDAGLPDYLVMHLDEGPRALEEVVASRETGVVLHSITNLERRIDKWVTLRGLQPDAGEPATDAAPTLYARPDIRTPYKAPATPVEKELVDVWQQFFGYENLGVNDNFFDLGGNSLKGISLIGIIHRRLGVAIPIREFFQRSTIAGLADYVSGQENTEAVRILPTETKDDYPLSAAQLRLYLTHQLNEESTRYNETYCFRIAGEPDAARLEGALREMISRHEIFRSQVLLKDGKPVQQVLETVEFALGQAESDEAGLPGLVRQLVKPFDFRQPPYLRAVLIRLRPAGYVLVLDFHHIIFDGISSKNFMSETAALYAGRFPGKPTLQYRDYVAFAEGRRQSGLWEQQREYWRREFAGPLPALDLPLDFPRPAALTDDGGLLAVALSPEQVRGLFACARQQNTSVYNVLLSVYLLFLSKISNSRDIILGTPTSGRNYPELDSMMGMFVNTLVLRNQVDPAGNFADFLGAVTAKTLKAFENQDYQYQDLLDDLSLVREPNRNPLFDVVYSHQNVGSEVLELPGLHIEPYPYQAQAAKFDLMLGVLEGDNDLRLSLSYNRQLFAPQTIGRFAAYLQRTVAFVLERPGERLADLDVVPADEKAFIAAHLHNDRSDYPAEETVISLFEQCVARTPGRVALTDNGRQETYESLNRRANQLARLLLDGGTKPREIVGVFLGRSSEVVVAMLAIAKAGCAYLPIDTEYPADRVDYVLRDSTAGTVITATEHLAALAGEYRCIDIRNLPDSAASLPETNLPRQAGPGDLLYIIYTSGTSGRPKGVMIEHRNVVRLLFNEHNLFDFSAQDTWTLYHSHAFDFSVWEMYGALLYGGRLVIVPAEDAKDTARLLTVLRQERVTVLNQTPSAFYNLSREALAGAAPLPDLRYVIFGGEALSPGKLRAWHARYPAVKLVNMYGITETTVHVTYKEIGPEEMDRNVSNIGRPIPTLTVSILDQYGNQQPVGCPGELCVGGKGVARGYLNKAELTARKFVQSPSGSGERLYRSGDLGRLLPNGELEYLGRIDHQVKIRGFRIELKEIETNLLACPSVTNAIVLVREDQNADKYLIAYYTAAGRLGAPDLRAYLARKVPAYMVPAYFVQIGAVPVTVHGKIDVNALPLPAADNTMEAFFAPRTPTELRLARLWQEELALDRVSVRESFFHMGGDSIKAIRLIQRIKAEFSHQLSPADLYARETIEDLAPLLTRERSGNLDQERQALKAGFAAYRDEVLGRAADPGNVEDAYPLTDIEQGMIFYYTANRGSGIYHDQFAFQLRYPRFDYGRFRQALGLMVDKHSILRTGFDLDGHSAPLHIVYRTAPQDVDLVDLMSYPGEEQVRQIRAMLDEDIRNPFGDDCPLWRIRIGRLDEERLVLLLIFHHAILDGWSVASLMTELGNTYRRLAQEPDYRPAPLKSTYADTVAEEQLGKQKSTAAGYWQQLLAHYNRVELSFVKGYAKRGAMQIYEFKPGGDLLARLRSAARAANVSLQNLLFAAYVYNLKIFSGSRDVTAGLVTNNRPLVEHGDQLVGCFLNTVPVRIEIEPGISWKDFVVQVHNRCVQVKQYERTPLSEIARAIGERNKDRNPIFDTLFNYVDFHVYAGLETEDQETGPQSPSLELPGSQTTNTLFDFEISVTNNDLVLLPKYDTVNIEAADVEKFCRYYLRILDCLVNSPEAAARVNDIVPAGEMQQLLRDYNATTAPYEASITLAGLFERRAAGAPEHPAVVYRGASVTYRQLNERANQLAHALREKGVGPGSLVGVIIDRSIEMIAAVLGILKAGGAYVPLEPYLPAQRMALILNDLGIATVVTKTTQAARISDLAGLVASLRHAVWLDRPAGQGELPGGLACLTAADLDRLPAHNLPAHATSGDIAYIIYTSGSTGTPKGVVVKHRPVVNVIEWVNKTFGVNEADRILFITSLGFDLSVYDVFGTLGAGATIHLMDNEQFADPRKVMDTLIDQAITIWDSAPAALQVLTPYLEYARERGAGTALRLVMLSGDWIPLALPDQLRETFTGARVVSLGGATEAAIWSNYYFIDRVEPGWKSIPYGKPIQNAHYYIFDDNLEVCPAGVPGNLYIGGACLATGYVNDPDLTGRKFIANPYNAGEIIYRTGDSAQWLPDGNMEFLGRKDGQVKIRGFRIETGEIARLLTRHPNVADAVVEVIKMPAGSFLCAYLVLRYPEEHHADLYRQYLAQHVPEYMIPDHFLVLDAIPATPNGKLDRKALPLPQPATSGGQTAPANPLERQLLAIWSRVLFTAESAIGTGSDFFELGGHSLNVTQLTAAIQKETGAELSIRDVFVHTTIKEQARLIFQNHPYLLEAPMETEREQLVI